MGLTTFWPLSQKPKNWPSEGRPPSDLFKTFGLLHVKLNIIPLSAQAKLAAKWTPPHYFVYHSTSGAISPKAQKAATASGDEGIPAATPRAETRTEPLQSPAATGAPEEKKVATDAPEEKEVGPDAAATVPQSQPVAAPDAPEETEGREDTVVEAAATLPESEPVEGPELSSAVRRRKTAHCALHRKNFIFVVLWGVRNISEAP